MSKVRVPAPEIQAKAVVVGTEVVAEAFFEGAVPFDTVGGPKLIIDLAIVLLDAQTELAQLPHSKGIDPIPPLQALRFGVYRSTGGKSGRSNAISEEKPKIVIRVYGKNAKEIAPDAIFVRGAEAKGQGKWRSVKEIPSDKADTQGFKVTKTRLYTEGKKRFYTDVTFESWPLGDPFLIIRPPH